VKHAKRRQSSNVSRETDVGKIASEARERVAGWLSDTTLSPRAGFLERIEKMAATLALWGARTNLTAEASDPAEIAFHIIDSLAPIAFAEGANRETLEADLAEGASVLDLGSGAGFPGLVLAAAFEARFMLAEARRKRASYLQVAAHEIQLENVTIERRCASAGAGNIAAGLYHLVTARAFGTSTELYEIAAAALRPGGILLLYASADQMLDVRTGEPLDDSRAPALRFDERASWTYRLPHGERVVTRTAVLWHKSPSA